MRNARKFPETARPFFSEPAGPNERFRPSQYYLPRYQVWKGSRLKCNGSYVASSCVFGVRDLKTLIQRPELVVHKLYFKFQPATYFCLLRNHWNRALDIKEQQKFNASSYSILAHVQLRKGRPYDELKFYSRDHGTNNY